MTDISFYDYQEILSDTLISDTNGGGRAHGVLAPGGGKTLVMGRNILEMSKQGEDTFTVFVPNKLLVYQSAEDMRQILGSDFEIVGNFSDTDDAGADDIDDAKGRTELSQILNNAEELEGYARRPVPDGKKRILISTYQSSPRLCDLVDKGGLDRNGRAPSAQMDEAHMIAGEKKVGSPFLQPSLARFHRHIFLTGTPKPPQQSQNRDAGDRSELQVSMSDQETFGPRSATYNYRDILPYGNVVDYRMHLALTTMADIQERFGDEPRDIADAMRLAAAVEIERLMDETPNQRVLAFSSNREKSQRFVDLVSEHFSQKDAWVRHVDASMDKGYTRETLEMMRTTPRYITSNVAMYGLGTNIKPLDTVAYLDPKGSAIDVVQSMNRAMRADRNTPGKIARIVVPVIVDEMSKEGIARAFTDGRFATMLTTIQGLATGDDKVDAALRKSAFQAGKGERPTVSPLSGNVVFSAPDAPSYDIHELKDFISTKIVGGLLDDFAFMAGRYAKFHEQYGRAPTPADDAELSSWTRRQIHDDMRNKLSKEDGDMLDTIDGWQWHPESSRTFKAMAERFEAEVAKKKAVHLPIHPNKIAAHDPGMKTWIKIVQKKHREGTLPVAQAQLLDGLEGWSWVVGSTQSAPSAKHVAEHIQAFFKRTLSNDQFLDAMGQARARYDRNSDIASYNDQASIGDGIKDLAARFAGYESLLFERDHPGASLSETDKNRIQTHADKFDQERLSNGDDAFPIGAVRRSPARRMEMTLSHRLDETTARMRHDRDGKTDLPGLGFKTRAPFIDVSFPDKATLDSVVEAHELGAISAGITLDMGGYDPSTKTFRFKALKVEDYQTVSKFGKPRSSSLSELRSLTKARGDRSRNADRQPRREATAATKPKVSVTTFLAYVRTGENADIFDEQTVTKATLSLRRKLKNGEIKTKTFMAFNKEHNFSWISPSEKSEDVARTLHAIGSQLLKNNETIDAMMIAPRDTALGKAATLLESALQAHTESKKDPFAAADGNLIDLGEKIRQLPPLSNGTLLHQASIEEGRRRQTHTQDRVTATDQQE